MSITVDRGLVTSCRGRWRDQLKVVVVDTQLVEAEAAQVIGAGRYEGTEGRMTERNGRRSKRLATKAGGIEIGIPKAQEGRFTCLPRVQWFIYLSVEGRRHPLGEDAILTRPVLAC